MGRLRILTLLLLAYVAVGCSVKGEIEEIQVDPVKILQKNTVTEFNSGARARVISSGAYVVSHALGNFNGKMVSKTPEEGYSVYMNVQGSVFSEAVEMPAFD